MMASMPILETVLLSREVAGVRIVDDISVRVRRAEVLAVTGPSGCSRVVSPAEQLLLRP